MKTIVSGACLLLAVSWLGGCSTSSSKELLDASAISFAEPGFALPRGSALAWRSDVVYLFDDAEERPESFQLFVQQEVESYLQGRGYDFDPSRADHGILAVAVLGADLDAAAVLREYRLTPSFPASRRYPRGTLVIAVYSLEDEKIRWRGAIQARIDVSEPEAARRARVRAHVARLLHLLPEQHY